MSHFEVPHGIFQAARNVCLGLLSGNIRPFQQIPDVGVQVSQKPTPLFINGVGPFYCIVELLELLLQILRVHRLAPSEQYQDRAIVPALPALTLAVTASIALAAALLINDRRLPALRAEIPNLHGPVGALHFRFNHMPHLVIGAVSHRVGDNALFAAQILAEDLTNSIGQ